MKLRGFFLIALLSLGFIAGCMNDSMETSDDVPTGSFGRKPVNADDQYLTDDQPGMSASPNNDSSSSDYRQEASSAPDEVPFEDARKLKKDMMKDPVANVGQY